MDMSKVIVSENGFAIFDYDNKKIINGSREFIFEDINTSLKTITVTLESGKSKDFSLSIFFDENTIKKIISFVKKNTSNLSEVLKNLNSEENLKYFL